MISIRMSGSLLAVSLLTVNSVKASEKNDLFAMTLEELQNVSIATKTEVDADVTPSSVSVITAEQIRQMGARNLNEVLDRIPGFHVSVGNQVYEPKVAVRGLANNRNNQVLFLLNGTRLSLPFKNSPIIQLTKSVVNIERIEVIRGPGSAIYGADAFAGVVNIVTRQAESYQGVEIGARVGSFKEHHAFIQYGGRHGDWDLTFSMEGQRGDGDSELLIPNDVQQVFDGIFNTNASLAPGPLQSRFKSLDLQIGVARGNWSAELWWWRQPDRGVGPGFAIALDPTGRIETSQLMMSVNYNKTLDDWTLAAHAAWLDADELVDLRLFPPGTVLPINESGNIGFPGIPTQFEDGLRGAAGRTMSVPQLEVSGVFEGFSAHRIRVGIEYRGEETRINERKNFGPGVTPGVLTDVTGTPFAYSKNGDRDVLGISLQDEWQINGTWQLTSGVRLDDFSDFGSSINPRIALVWRGEGPWTVKALYGEAFRPPTVTDQFLINNPASIGNPDLSPETIDTLELNVGYQSSADYALNLQLFAYQAEDLIAFVPDAATNSSIAQNAEQIDGKGIEVEGYWQVTPQWRLEGHISWVDTDQHSNDLNAGFSPHLHAYLSSVWRPSEHVTWQTQLRWIADRKREAGDVRSAPADYALVDSQITLHSVLPKTDFTLMVKNLLDRDARTPFNPALTEDIPLAGRSFMAEMRYAF